MSRQPTDLRAGFIERVGIAFAMAVCVGAVLATLSMLIGYADAFALASTIAATLYAAWIVLRSAERRAMILAAVCWTLSIVGLLALMPGPMLHMAGLLLMIWVMRALYVYRSPMAALLDAGLVLLAMMAGYWALTQTFSPAIATWTTFLVLAVLVRSPRDSRLDADSTRANQPTSSSERFERAKAAADQAVTNLSHSV
jgi:hypothetical protein